MKTTSPQKTGWASFFFGADLMRRAFKFFASLQLAVGTLLTLMVVLAAGTIVESRFSSDAARILIYSSPWFGLIMIVLVVNLACSALDRLPWQKKHIGFVLTHLGIITILGGSLATQQFAVDAQMVLEEGSTGKWATLKQPMLYFYSQEYKDERSISLPEHAFNWQGRQKIAALKTENKKADIFLTSYYPKARAVPEWAADASGPAAVKVTLHNSFLNVTQWLADDPENREVQMGPAKLRLLAAADLAGEPAPDQKVYLEIDRGEEKNQLPLPDKKALPFEQTLPSGIKVKVAELYDYAYVEDNILKEGLAGQHPENPAAVLQISVSVPSAQPATAAKTITEVHTVFANFPDFPTVHGRPQSELGLRVGYHKPNAGAKNEGHELRFILQPGGLSYQIVDGNGVRQSAATPGQDIATGWMELQFKVEQFLPHAAEHLNVTRLADDDRSENAAPAAEIELHTTTASQKIWLAEGAHKTTMFEAGLFEFVFGRRQIPLGFEVALKDFRVKNDPGSDKPASFESDVVLKDFSRGVALDKTISMNQPLEYRGFKIFQAGYIPNPGGPAVSSFAVGRDPGIPIKYAGAIVMVVGILLMFYTRAYSTTNAKGLK